jgi:enoyl-CoA hydratase/carnithine racemase
MTKLSDYAERYENIRLRREDGILEMQLHSDGGPLRWSAIPDREVGECLRDIAGDRENRCLILTGTGDTFCAAADPEGGARVLAEVGGNPLDFLHSLYDQAYRLQINHLDVPVPIIAAVNGPATWHAEIALLGDLVIATADSYFQDAPHFPSNLVPGDGVHVVWPALLGPNLGRYFLLTGMKLHAAEAYQRGLVQEIVERDALLPRAWELARAITRQPDNIVRPTRSVLVQKIRKDMLDLLPDGLSKELTAALHGMARGQWPGRTEPFDFSAPRS